jgi:hypothetical protein
MTWSSVTSPGRSARSSGGTEAMTSALTVSERAFGGQVFALRRRLDGVVNVRLDGAFRRSGYEDS